MLSTSSAANRLGPECLESKKALTRRRKASLFRSSSGQPDEHNLLADALYLPQSLHLSSSSDSKFFYNSFNNLFHLMSNRQCSSFVGKSCWR
uniref:Uncharacterized protein n=1 Tax=Meloidogyne incognita TaxID=6306 RepID=A0A914KHR2_MELIC